MPVGKITALYVAPARHAPMEEREEVTVEAGAGILGDRYHGSRHRHVTVQADPDLVEAAERLGAPVPPAATRRNVTISGPVPRDPGRRLRIGDVLLEVVRVAAPCRVMEETIGPGGQEALRHRGGSAFRALSSGTIRLGDLVTEEDGVS
jgi:MOSC domain-containing protein YiiM